MKKLTELCFLIHGFVWSCRDWSAAAGEAAVRLRPYLTREQACASLWYARLAAFPESAALVVIPAGRGEPASAFYELAASTLGDRFFMLDSPDCLAPEFWSAGDDAYRASVLAEFESAFVKQFMAWNKEEIDTALHTRACCRQFQALLAERGYAFDPATVPAEAWGASFDGCVAKYSLNLRRMLGLSRPIAIDFAMSVPDAEFLLQGWRGESIPLANGLRLFLLVNGDQIAALYTFTASSLADPATCVRVGLAPEGAMVVSKQGTRLWPDPQTYVLSTAPLGFYEPPQVVVKYEDGGLHVPVSAGVVYRLAKAPAYVLMPPGLPYAEARAILTSAVLR